jgi:hypothetical protein
MFSSSRNVLRQQVVRVVIELSHPEHAIQHKFHAENKVIGKPHATMVKLQHKVMHEPGICRQVLNCNGYFVDEGLDYGNLLALRNPMAPWPEDDCFSSLQQVRVSLRYIRSYPAAWHGRNCRRA